jgi:tripartite-type tricarboxylate transporter receptor subunit TctC
MLRKLGAFVALASLIVGLPALAADEFPNRPIRLVYPFPAGNVLDTMGRLVGDRFQAATGQPFVYDYKSGGAGVIAAQTVQTAKPDGYTLLMATSGMMTINPHTYANLPYDPFNDFAPVIMGIGTQMLFAGRTGMPANFPDFLAYTKANPGKVSFASFTPGNPSHFAGVILNQLAGIDMLHVGYRGTPPATTDLVGGQVDTAFLPITALKQHVEAGTLKAYAITGGEPSPLLPGVPTFKQLGYPKMEIYIWAGFMVPAGTPEPVIQKLNQEIAKAFAVPEVQARLRDVDLTPLPGTPADFTRFMRADSERWAEAVKISGFKAE